MVKERGDEMSHVENETKVGNVQDRFPNDDLQLQDGERVGCYRGILTKYSLYLLPFLSHIYFDFKYVGF